MKIQNQDVRFALDRAQSKDTEPCVPEEFEAIFARQLLKQAREAVSHLRNEEVSPEKDLYHSFFDEQVAQILAEQRSLGIAKELEAWLDQEKSTQAPTKEQFESPS
jgi:Rod binding domain-containing protein